MNQIPVTDARKLFTDELAVVFKERVQVPSFLRSFFPTKEYTSKKISVEVRRATEKLAVDVERGTEGNPNKVTPFTEKKFVPPYYREYFNVTDLDAYDQLFGAGDAYISSRIFSMLLEETAEEMMLLQDKIERAYELQCSQVFDTGIVKLKALTNINFKRKAESKLTLVGGDLWDAAGSNPYNNLETAAKFLREQGKIQGNVMNVIMGGDALNAFHANEKVQKRSDIRNFNLDEVRAPQKAATGSTMHGVHSSGSYIFRIWGYPEVYDGPGGSTPYVDPKKVIVLPENPNFSLNFGAVPQLVGDDGGVKKGAFLIGEYKDERNASHIMDIKSAGVAVPVQVDAIHTTKVLG